MGANSFDDSFRMCECGHMNYVHRPDCKHYRPLAAPVRDCSCKTFTLKEEE